MGPVRVIRVTRNMLALHWHPPSHNSGVAALEKYVIEKREVDATFWSTCGSCARDVTAYCVTDLVENTFYYFRILAVNAFGCSDALETSQPITPNRVFGMLSLSGTPKLVFHVKYLSNKYWIGFRISRNRK